MLNLSANEARVIGCLMEKSVVTPDQYPLTPGVGKTAIVEGLAQRIIAGKVPRDLQDKHLVRV